jgi:hypothetical protein
MPYVLACIDGTGSTEWRRPDGLNSHVYRFYKDAVVEPDFKLYRHGPDTAGLKMGGIVEDVTAWVLKAVAARRKADPKKDVEIVLVGHSRGAVAATVVANRLAAPKIPDACAVPIRVKFLGLYDAVDRSFLSVDTTLRNVETVYHAVRGNRDFFGGSRWSFDTVKYDRPVLAWDYNTSHGGIGGDPGLFTPLGGLAADYYCNALQVVMTDDDLRVRYGTVHMPTRGGMPMPTNIPRFRQLTGEAYSARVEQLREFLQQSWYADLDVRSCAAWTCGAGLFGRTSPHIPYADANAGYAQRLALALGWPSLQWP